MYLEKVTIIIVNHGSRRQSLAIGTSSVLFSFITFFHNVTMTN